MHLFCKCKIPDFKSSLKVDVLCCAALNRSVMSDSLQPLGLQPARFLCPWDFPGKNIVIIFSSKNSMCNST